MALTRVSGNLIGQNTVTNQNIAASVQDAYGWRNRIINGDMRIDQRNAGASVTATGSFPVDRWSVTNTSNGAFSAQQNSSGPAGFNNSLLVTVTTAQTAGTGNLSPIQSIEGTNVADLGWGTANAQTVTLSFWVRSSLTGTFGGVLRNSGATRTYPYTYTISSANTWEYKTVTIEGDTSGTWLTTNEIGVQVRFSLFATTDTQQTAGAWFNGSATGATGQTQLGSTLNATWQVTGVQLETASVATAFERRDFGRELAMCQRYFETTYPVGVAVGSVNQGPIHFRAMPSGSVDYRCFNYQVAKRATPTLTAYNGDTGSSGNWRGSGGLSRTITLTAYGNWGFRSFGWTLGDYVQSGHFTASSEF